MAKSEDAVPATQEGEHSVDDNNNTDSSDSHDQDAQDDAKSSASGGKYQLRPRSAAARRLCFESDWNLGESIRHKPRTPPLSRYRRKTANARERYRMRQINTAFESLRGVLPSWVCSRRAAAEMTKIATLRLASAYIRSLQDILDGNAPEDTCSWVLSTIFERPQKRSDAQNALSPAAAEDSSSDHDLATLLASSEAQVLHHNLDSLSCLLGPDPPAPRTWADGHYPPTPLVT